MLAQPTQFACVLSSGSTWSMPSIFAAPGDVWPTGGSASAYAVFTDTAGAVLANVAGAISADTVDFVGVPHTVVDPIPAGANCEIFITDSSGNPYKIRYGRVVRREVSFPNSPAVNISYQPLAFTDNLQRTAIGNSWVPITGSAQLYDNSSSSQPYGLGATQELLSSSDAALRWFQPLATDNFEINISILNKAGLIASQLMIFCAADINFTSGLVAQLQSGAHKCQLGVAATSTTITDEGSVVSDTQANGDNYTVSYNNNSAVFAVYKNNSTTPLASWADTGALVPHGPGYRYFGLAWHNLPLTNGLQVSAIAAQDAL